MINEEIANKTLHVELGATKRIARAMISVIKKILQKSKALGGLGKYIQQEGNEVKLKDMVKKGQLEEIPIKEAELKELRKELNRYGVKFSVMRDKGTGNYSVFFQAKDTKVMDLAFKKAIETSEKKHDQKESVRKQINQFKERVKDTVNKDKVKHKHKEQSL